MTKRSAVLVLGLLVMLFLSIILGAFFLKSINENNLVRRYITSTRAFWVAEAGVSQAMRNLPNSPTDGTLGNYTYQTTTTYRTTINASDYYNITSTGIVNLSTGGNVTRTLNVVVKTAAIDPDKFQYAIQAANELCFGGNCSKDPYTYINPDNPPGCDGHDCYKELDGTINFSDLFGYSLNDVSNIATHYTEDSFPGTVSGVTWVDVTQGETLMATGDTVGSGVLIVDGNVHFGGTYVFDGIIYVLGTMDAYGTFVLNGSIIVASTAGIDDINGTPDLNWDPDAIANALNDLNAASGTNVSIVSWNEQQ